MKLSLTGWRSIVQCALCYTALLWLGISQAQTTYVHDANGRVVAVTQSNGSTVQYAYDALGHVGPVGAPLSAGRLAIFAFTPTHGVAGTQVTILGQGFDVNATNDNVSFNGTAATVISAATNQLIVAVPSGVTTGPISVASDGQATISATSFVVDDTGEPPTITQISPTVVTAGGTVTITGTHLDPIAGNTIISTGGMYTQSPSLINDTQLQYVPVTSGNVIVETPYGDATSTTPVIVLPSGVSSNSVTSTGAATVGGTPATLTIGAAGQIGALTFNGSLGQWLSLQASNISASAGGANYSVYAPGNVLIQQGMLSAAAPSIHLPQLQVSGPYLVTFQANTTGAQFTVTVQSDPVPTLPAALVVAANAPGQSERVVFTATAGENLELTLSGVSITGSSQALNVQAYNASGVSLNIPTSCPNTYTCRYPLWNLAAGTYTVVVSPQNATSTFSTNVILAPDIQGGALSANTPVSVNLGTGQVVRYTFTAIQGSNVALNLSDVNTGNAAWPVEVNVYSPSGGTITTSDYYSVFNAPGSNGSSTLNLSNLPATGTYTLVVYTSGMSGTAQLTFLPVATNSLPDTGANQAVAAAMAGQNLYLTFTASQGDNQELTLSNVSVTGSSSAVTVNVYNASGTNISSSSNCANTYTCRYPLWNLAAGTYTVVISPPTTSSTIGTNVMLQPDIQGGALSANTAANINLGTGQVARYTFTATQGGNVAVNLSGVYTGNAGWPVDVNVYSPSGGTITTSDYYSTFNAPGTNGASTLNLSNLPATGTYTLVVYTSGVPGTAQLVFTADTATNIPDTGASQTVAATMAGQNLYLSFTANQGDNQELTLSNVSITGSSSAVTVNVYNASGTNISSASNCASTYTCRYPLWNLAAGTYTVVISPPTTSSTISINVMLQPDIQGGALSANTPVSVNLGTGQVTRYTFTATQGGSVALSLSGVNTGNAGWPLDVNVYSPSTGTISTANYYATFNAPGSNGSNSLTLTNLPVSGTYTLVVYTSGVPATAQLTLESQ